MISCITNSMIISGGTGGRPIPGYLVCYLLACYIITMYDNRHTLHVISCVLLVVCVYIYTYISMV